MTTDIKAEPRARSSVGANLPGDLRVTQLRLVRSEWVKFWSLRSSYFALASAVVGMIGFGVLSTAVTAAHWQQMSPRRRADFNPVDASLAGFQLAQLIIGVLGVLLITGEYGTGMIRASMAAAPKRLPVIWAKAIVFTAVAFVVGTATSFIVFFAGQAALSGAHLNVTLGAPGALRAVIGTGLYLTGIGLLGGALGWIIRNTAGGIATLLGMILILPVLANVLPDSWQPNVTRVLPSVAGQYVATAQPGGLLSPWTGFLVFCGYIVVGFVASAILVRRRDA